MNLQLAIGVVLGVVITVLSVMAAFAFIDPANSGAPSSLYLFFKDIGGPVAAGFGGAAAGAYLSYAFQKHMLAITENKIDSKAYNKGFTILLAKYSGLQSIRNNTIFPCQNKELRFIHIPSLDGVQVVQQRADDLLCELVMEAGESELYGRIVEAETLYFTAYALLEVRSTMYGVHRVRSDAAVPKYGNRIGLAELVEIHGIPDLVRLYTATEELINAVDDAFERLTFVLKSLEGKCAKKLKARLGKVLVSATGFEEDVKKVNKPFFKDISALVNFLERARTA